MSFEINITFKGLDTMKIINFFFGKMICMCIGHNKVIDTVMRCKDGHQVVFWRCTRCGIDNYRDR